METKVEYNETGAILTIMGLTLDEIAWMKHYFKEHFIEIKDKHDNNNTSE